ncbi:hypothetical protein NHG68_26250 (plasmid) [Enterobacter sp. Z1]|nr:hypothetical protein NHG68_26250 [Enterobacter sp. Z1]
MNRKTALTLSLVVLLSTPQLATAGMSLFGSVTGRGEESFLMAKKKALADKDPGMPGWNCLPVTQAISPAIFVNNTANWQLHWF